MLVTREKKMRLPANRAGRLTRSPHRGRTRVVRPATGTWGRNLKALRAYMHRRSQSSGPVSEPRTQAWMPLSARHRLKHGLKSDWPTLKIPEILNSKFLGVTTGCRGQHERMRALVMLWPRADLSCILQQSQCVLCGDFHAELRSQRS